LHIGACDFASHVYVNGIEVGSHIGGYTPFSFDITDALASNPNFIISIYAEDDTRSEAQPRGKQSPEYNSFGCLYTRTTGIWQTVWLEAVPSSYIGEIKITPQFEAGAVLAEVKTDGAFAGRGGKVKLTAKASGKTVGETIVSVSGAQAGAFVVLSEKHAWSPSDPFLYDLRIDLLDSADKVIDTVYSYFGLRSVAINDYAVEINGKPVFQRLILDQGFYPDGIYTAPSEAALKKDIELSQDMGFNGARLHQKVFEPRFLYWADKLGYLVWGETPDWGLDVREAKGFSTFTLSWIEELERDYNHPSIVGWCPYNEHDYVGNPEAFRSIYQLTKAYDHTRPVIDTSGHVHVATDIYDVHEYEQDPVKFAAQFESLKSGVGTVFTNSVGSYQIPYKPGMPYMVSEYGGIKWSPNNVSSNAWGYGDGPKTLDEFIERYRGLTDALLDNPKMFGFCYTQLTDVEQEVNGLYYYDRSSKFDSSIIKAITSRKAAIETE
jgi:beta-galactosidase/beta-glucuronidase